MNAFIDTSGATAAAPSHDDRQSVNDKSDSPEPEKEPKTTVEESVDKNDSHKRTADRCAAAQGSYGLQARLRPRVLHFLLE